MWELFGKKDPPSKNDFINTPISGMFLSEVLYRISSNILDERKNIVKGKYGILAGIFQHYDYWNNKIFELVTLGFGPALFPG